MYQLGGGKTGHLQVEMGHLKVGLIVVEYIVGRWHRLGKCRKAFQCIHRYKYIPMGNYKIHFDSQDSKPGFDIQGLRNPRDTNIHWDLYTNLIWKFVFCQIIISVEKKFTFGSIIFIGYRSCYTAVGQEILKSPVQKNSWNQILIISRNFFLT